MDFWPIFPGSKQKVTPGPSIKKEIEVPNLDKKDKSLTYTNLAWKNRGV